jgi:hypothetical protein
MHEDPSHSWLGKALLCATLLLGATDLSAKTGTKAAGLAAAPVVTTISGSPLEVHVGDDNSFQIFNSNVPGAGQIYPSAATDTADMGWFVRTADTLYAPNFAEHSGTATSNIGAYTPFTPGSLSRVSGSGSAADPFRVTVGSALGASGIAATQQVRYVNGDNYFTKSLTLTNNGAAQSVKIFLGADIYLADDDSGVPYLATASTSAGGQDCGAAPSYTILLIPQTPPDGYSAKSYSDVWSLIGAGQLDDAVLAGSCLDNGAALQWNRTLAAGASVTVQTAVSFGDIPPIALFNVTAVDPSSGAVGSTVPVTITGLGFQSGTTFGFGAGVSVSDLVVVDSNTATATLTIAPAATPGPRDVTGSQSPGGLGAALPGGFTVTGGGVPGFGVAAVTPASGAVGSTLHVTIDGSGFQPGTSFDFGAGVAISNLVVVDADRATATLSIAADATPGPRDVTGSQAPGGATAVLSGGFRVVGGGVPPSDATAVPTLGMTALFALILAFAGLAAAHAHRRRLRRD